MGDEDNADAVTSFLKGSIKINGRKGKPNAQQNKLEVESFSYNAITAYPNPMGQDGFYISFPVELGGQILKGTMHDFNGRLLITQNFEVPVGGGDIFWNLDHGEWDQGVYILNLKGSSNEYQIQLMKN